MAKMATADERMARIEGILEQMNVRLGRVESDLRRLYDTKADKWEIRIWFIILILLMTALSRLS